MYEIKTEVVVNKAVEDVFTILTEKIPENLAKTNPKLLLFEQLTEGTIRKGTRFRQISARDGSEYDFSESEFLKDIDLDELEPDLRKELKETLIEVATFEINKLFELIVIEEGATILEIFSFKNVNGSTKVTIHLQVKLGFKGRKISSFFGNLFLDLMMKKFGKNELEKAELDLNDHFKALIESESLNNYPD